MPRSTINDTLLHLTHHYAQIQGLCTPAKTHPLPDDILGEIDRSSRHSATYVALIAISDLAPDFTPLLHPAIDEKKRRSIALANQLTDLAELLGKAGIPMVALKGAAFLADASPQNLPYWREMLDLDLLVPHDRLADAASILRENGYHADDKAHIETDYHYPALIPSDKQYPATIELHIEAGWDSQTILPASRIFADAHPSKLSPHLLVPADIDRAAHLIFHAQIADRGARNRLLWVKDALDYIHLSSASPDCFSKAAERFRIAGHNDAAASFLWAMAYFWKPEETATRANQLEDKAEKAQAAIGHEMFDNFLQGHLQKPTSLPAKLAELGDRPQLRKHVIRGLMSPHRRKRFLAWMLPRKS